MAGVGFAGAGLAEVYVMRSLHKEKMKKMEMEQAKSSAHDDDDNKAFDENKTSSPGCFFWVSKRTHSAKVSSADSTEKPV
ncbi:hypothetical protein PTKIN_Ptkin01aG0037000 [Pterospermum kingtungense]